MIGAGGMGEVYRARDQRLRRNVAVKVLPASAPPDCLQRFEAEARAAGTLNHPNVLAVYDVGRTASIAYIVSELLEGESLRSRLLDAGTLPVRTALDYTRQILKGLEAAHRTGIVHRDLKPENLFLTRDGRVKILDFGIAKLVHADSEDGRTATVETVTSPGMTLGTIGYMSPEQVRGEAVDPRSDIFALGVVAQEMLSGAPPFRRDTTVESLNAILKDDPPELPVEVPPAVAMIFRRCLEKKPDDRFHTAHDLALAIEAATLARDGDASSAGTRARTGRYRWPVTVLGGIALVAAGIGAGTFIEKRLDPDSTPSYQRLTFRRGLIRSARFAPDGQTVYYAAAWDGGPTRISVVRPGSPESHPLDLPEANILAISSAGELALALGSHLEGVIPYGTLARVSLAGGLPREIAEDVKYADWSSDGSELAIVRRVARVDQLEFPLGQTLVASTGSGLGGLGFPRISPGGDRVAFVEYSEGLHGHVAIVDRAGAKTVVSDDYVNIFGLAWKGDEIWFTAADEQPLFRALHAVRPGDNPRLLARVPANTSLHDIAPNGNAVIARTDDRHEFAVVRAGETRERSFAWLDASRVADLSRDGHWILFSEFGQGGGRDSSVYLRQADGSPAVRLGSGFALALSPDLKWALARRALGPPLYLDLIPTGAGDTRRIQGHGLAYLEGRWIPDGRLVVRAREEAGQPRLYLVDPGGAKPRALPPEGVGLWSLSPDGGRVAVSGSDGSLTIYGIETADTRTLPRLAGRPRLVGWTEQGLLVTRGDGTEHAYRRIFSVDPATGRERLWTEILPSDPAGVMYLSNFQVTPDGRTYAYSWHRALSDLYLVEGIR